MVVELKMCRFEASPWGFRLVGGSDYDYPLTVVKVTPDSIAEKAGLQVGDIIVRINDISASPLTHNEAHDVILHCGNTFFFGVKRETEDHPNSEQQQMSDEYEQNVEVTLPSPEIRQNPEDNSVSLSIKVKSPQLQKQNAIDEEERLEQEIAEILSEEKEVLKEHNVVGIFPKPGVCMSSKVLRQLNEDATKTREEILKEQRRWTTFLQKPNRPVLKSKAELEAEQIKQEHPYKVVIQKQPKPKVAPDRVPTPPWREPSPEPEPEPKPESPVEEVPIADSEVPDLMPLNNNCDENSDESTTATNDEQQENKQEENADDTKLNEEINKEDKEEAEIEKTEEEILLEKQLAEVQQQLQALSNLPNTIQATLDAVTKQLAELLPSINSIKKHSPVDISQVPDKIEKVHLEDQIKLDLKPIEEEQEEQLVNEQPSEYEPNESLPSIENEQQNKEEENKIEETQTESKPSSDVIDYKNIKEREENEAELENIKWDTEQQKAKKEEQFVKKQKENSLIEELQQRISNMDHIDGGGVKKKRSRLFGPLVPSTRPLILPGGRKWRTPKDAFNEEFIAGVLSSQAELISGNAIGPTYESPLLGYDERVNFMKYQKPEKKVDLDKSEVFKVLHNLDKKPKHGIEVRPPIVPAEEDIRNVAASCG
ncbi:golgin subfamily A member 6-like protein 1 isoform X2 [Condylostylus longicornis]|uniref:golgin subfamily A member 6-like protein 1 isoform X2 n=1 Tax=Condylostylus longicornis TaxID=2530218 RepID=UPI00244DF481|nr:golgin subfamily A member 6-like protein 1 isoform X2 [Condylostylus longicornis]